MYAWSTLTAQEADEKGRYKTFHPGDEVDAGTLGIDDEDFQQLVNSGAVREAEYPVPPDYDGSPVEYVRDQLREAASEQFMQALPFGTTAPISERPPGSMPTVPMFDERAREAMELTGFDPDKPAEEGKEPELSELDKEKAEAAAAKESSTTAAPAPATPPAQPQPSTTS